MTYNRVCGIYIIALMMITFNAGVSAAPPAVRSCSELYFNGYRTNGLFSIDPDGLATGIDAFQVYCDFDSNDFSEFPRGISESGTNIDGGWHETATDCGPGECRKTIVYDNGATVDKLATLCDYSQACRQKIYLLCDWVAIWFEGAQENWWEDRNGAKAPSWGTPSFSTKGCRCSLSSSCLDGEPYCNCDENYSRTEDSGYIEDKDHLPVKTLALGDTEGGFGFGEESWHRVDALKALGTICTLQAIANCDLVSCVSTSAYKCFFCSGDYGSVLGSAFAIAADKLSCIKQCSWRTDSNSCYPGSCTDFACTCTNGFSGLHCLQIANPPTLSYSLGKLNHQDGTTTVESPTTQDSTDTVYTSTKAISTITIDWRSAFQVTVPPIHNYMESADIGVVDAKVWIKVNNVDLIPVSTCPVSGNQDAPNKNFVPCLMTLNVDLSGVDTDDVLKYKVNSVSGGFQKMYDRDNDDPDTTMTSRYYVSKEVTHEATWTFDFVSPVHCITTDDCRKDMLYVGDDVTTVANVSITWTGWDDTTAGIHNYNFEIWELTGNLGSELVEDTSNAPLFSEYNITSGHTETLPRTGVYSVLLIVRDNCLPEPGNYKISRRLVFFDAGDTSVILHDANPFRVTSATANTTYNWQIVVEDSGPTQVDLEWTGHIINEKHHNLHLLKSIGEYDIEAIDADFDQYFGLRGRADIPDSLAITKFRIFYDVDHMGGASVTTPSESDRSAWIDEHVNNTESYDIQLVDGDSVRFWIWATDIVNQTIEDEVLVHFDSSPPEIINFWLVYDGEEDVFVHSLIELHEMRVEFKTWDIHSGLKSIEWRLYDNFTDPVTEHGNGAVSVEQWVPDNCTADDLCECRPIGECYNTYYGFSPDFTSGRHDHDYFLTLTITNNAELFITPTIKISVDTSAPEPGIVHDGLVDSNEIDYQSEMELNVHWEGFFDKESGVKFYEYIFDTVCWDQDDWKTTIRENMTRTEESFATWNATSPGTYFVTVVAFNRAIDPSIPVCSDGVVIDDTAPKLGGIFLANARIRPGILKNDSGDVFYADHLGYLYDLPDATDACRNKISAAAASIDVYPRAPGDTVSTDIISDVNCTALDPVGDTMYLTSDKYVSVSWEASDDESQFFDFEVGLASAANNPDPDLVTFRSTSRQENFILFHTAAGQDSMFYIFVKAINKAQLSTTKVIGPVIVDTTPPEFLDSGEITLAIEDDHLTARWTDGDFVDSSDSKLRYYVAIGHTPEDTSTLVYRPMTDYVSGPCQLQSSCAAVPVEDLDWGIHGDHVYYLTVRAENTGGLAVVVTSNLYYHSVQLPSKGVVLDVLSSSVFGTTFSSKPDIDSQTETSSFAARWYGFKHPHLEVTYHFAIGTTPGTDDVTGSFLDVGAVLEYTKSGLSLVQHQKYYTTIRAITTAGSVDVSSDGVVILSEGGVPTGAVAFDGIGCQNFEQVPTVDMTHQNDHYSPACSEDTDYQLSSSSAQAHWTIPEALAPLITHVVWQFEEEFYGGDSQWSMYLEKDLGLVTEHTEAGVFLQAGRRYRSTLLLCHGEICFQPISTNGFVVLSQPPTIGSIVVENVVQGVDQTDVQLAFQPFVHGYVEDSSLTSEDLMDYYDWLIMDEAGLDGGIYAWKKIEADEMVVADNKITFNASYGKNYSQTECLYINMRGHNKAGLFNTATTEVFDCDDPAERVPRNVLDSAEIVILELNDHWLFPDNDYTINSTRLSGVWPELRYNIYEWAIIEDSGAYGNLDMGLKYPCDHDGVVKCGYTDNEFINVYNMQLTHGQLYRVCIHANTTTHQHEKWDEVLEELSECSDGIVIDETPPVPGSVWTGYGDGNKYQMSSSEIVIHWTTFVDVEEHNMALHDSGIQYYEYAIGTGSGRDDIVVFTKASITNNVIVSDLTLQDGYKYYATIRATNFVGLSSNATSEALFIDRTPPFVNSYNLEVGGNIVTSTTAVTARWPGVFLDNQSGVKYYKWCIGSNPGHADVMPYTMVTSEEATSDPDQPLTLQEGHSYYVTIKAFNYVDLGTVQIFGAFLVDESPPEAGHVFDGIPSANQKDQDYQQETTSLHAFWEGFHDPHSDVISFSWKIGLCKGCDDIVRERYIGKATEASANNLNLQLGFTYYATVTSCNAADLCTSVTSDGILIDDSPPTVGRVNDGSPERGELDYQSSRTVISAHWRSFSDPHSRLSHYEWWAGTTAGADDIMSAQRLHLSESAIAKLDMDMPENTLIFTTVRAYNRAGLYSEATTDGFKSDTTPPVNINIPTIDTTFGVWVSNTQVIRTALRFTWKFTDYESEMLWHQISLSTHHNGESDLPNKMVNGGETDFSFADSDLHDGSIYTIRMLGCNGARLCTEAVSTPFKVDSSPPIIGTYATITAHSPNLQRHLDGWMSWHDDAGGDFIKLAWLGFTDCHSSITHYYVTVGSEYATSDLTSSGPVMVNHDVDGPDSETDEGAIQTATINVAGDITSYGTIFVALWAINGVGLPSLRLHAAFELGSSGSPTEGHLILIRGDPRCVAETCEGHCVCAPLNQLCMQGSCTDVSGAGNLNTEIEVYDVLDLNFPDSVTAGEDLDFSPLRCMIAAQWKVSTSKGLSIVRYEWTVGFSAEATPTGVFDPSVDRVWFDSELDTYAVLMLEEEQELTVGISYDFFVRAWYDDNTFAVFRSDGIIPDITPPRVVTVLGVKIKDLDTASDTRDIEFITKSTDISTTWDSVFVEEANAMSHFKIALGTGPGVDDIVGFDDLADFSDTDVTATFTGLSLEIGVWYFISVRAYNKAGLYTTQSSDGFLVDTIAPRIGVITDGLALHDVEYQNSTTLVSASWHGFLDSESFIDYYMWCVGIDDSDPDEAGLVPCVNVGLKLNSFEDLTTPLTNGDSFVSKVYAVDTANLKSPVIISDGVIVDTTPPVPQMPSVNPGNALQNPSFEDVESSGAALLSLDEASSDTGARPDVWLTGSGSICAVVEGGEGIAYDGISFAALKGQISQSFTTAPGEKYHITFYVSIVEPSVDPLLKQEGCIEVYDVDNNFVLREVYRLFNRPLGTDMSSISWMFHQFNFLAEKTQYTIALSSVGDTNGILIDNVQVEHLSFTTPSDLTMPLVDVGTQFVHDWSSIHASWHFIDTESPIVEYQWAIGTIRGGTQVQTFVSVGTRTHTYNSQLHLQQGSVLYVTVMAMNAAELIRLAYAAPVIIDTTPPEIKYVYDGDVPDTDIVYQSTETISASWMSEDEDSGIDFCVWFAGKVPGTSELSDPVQSSTPLSDTVQLIPSDFKEAIMNGDTVYVTVQCKNNAGLTIQKSSNGVAILTSGPSAQSAVIRVINPSETQYATREAIQSLTGEKLVALEGFFDTLGIVKYQCKLTEEGIEGEWTDCGTGNATSIRWFGQDFITNTNYAVSIRAINHADLVGGEINDVFSIETIKPFQIDLGNVPPIRASWLSNVHSCTDPVCISNMFFTWDGVFSSETPMIYEISLGTVEGGADILNWVETLETFIYVDDVIYQDVYITVTAINTAGLYYTINQRVFT